MLSEISPRTNDETTSLLRRMDAGVSRVERSIWLVLKDHLWTAPGVMRQHEGMIISEWIDQLYDQCQISILIRVLLGIYLIRAGDGVITFTLLVFTIQKLIPLESPKPFLSFDRFEAAYKDTYKTVIGINLQTYCQSFVAVKRTCRLIMLVQSYIWLSSVFTSFYFVIPLVALFFTSVVTVMVNYKVDDRKLAAIFGWLLSYSCYFFVENCGIVYLLLNGNLDDVSFEYSGFKVALNEDILFLLLAVTFFFSFLNFVLLIHSFRRFNSNNQQSSNTWEERRHLFNFLYEFEMGGERDKLSAVHGH